ncbi:signal recognition particle subunit srp68 [Purpureocillium takamizusanense]|uniref:Signal recognition particle subunit SRP68 n=1 Tax=Purpureocillium takamizusanense TaxID=2060973 RepID=A0A9Q8QLD6_9HYPO|nr:signal recognition particle subunit srp68 [Purpureocillium takamizusanense]UNI21750.1 signal recognition particle subunit srp68 [Purpureocillium takamizusanense]
MDITSFIVQGRDQALLYGDYSTYHSQLAKRLLNTRKKLGIATRNRGKFHNKDKVTAEDVAASHEHVHLLLLTSERAFAQAMSIKAAHTADQKGLSSRTRSHIVSRLDKAARAAQDLVDALSQKSVSGASDNDVLEAKAYAALIRGAMLFEKHTWEPCLQSYAVARVVYSALAMTGSGDLFKDLLSETIDPSIRYAAYQLKTPRTVPIPAIARKAFPRSDAELVREVDKIDPSILADADAAAKTGITAESAPRTLTWRSREVQIEDAQISLAWASVEAAKSRLAAAVEVSKDKEPHEVAAVYDEILTATQDAVDATKQAIDELRAEGVAQSDPRMQGLQITRTAVNYEMISWRIGRNRVLTGPQDGAPEVYGSLRRKKKSQAAEDAGSKERELPTRKKLVKLKEKLALYDGTLQNLESINELPGVAADEGLASRLDAVANYFESLKCLSIARSHAIVGNVANALALISRAAELCQESASKLPKRSDTTGSSALNVEVTSESVATLASLLDGELQRHRAIVHIDNLRKGEGNEAGRRSRIPLLERLQEYPPNGVDLSNIVEFPPKLALIPMKPIFLDVAWNYIDYPGKTSAATATPAAAPGPAKEQPAPQAKRGWFGFGRS